MIFMPPQHGKSELVSRKLPAFILGIDPERKIVGSSYSADLASSFNRDIQRTISSEEYAKIFPNTRLHNQKDRSSSGQSYMRNTDIFEVVGHSGFYKSVGIMGSLTGRPADLAIIDDPVKDALEAYSPRQRDRAWDWYTNVLETRLHNDSQVLVTMTRWHEDDLAGRLLLQGDWEVLTLEALKETTAPWDPRAYGEALWPSRHSKEKIERLKAMSNRVFVSLYQQRPAPEEGDMIKTKWFGDFSPTPELLALPRNFYTDTSYGKEEGDNTATICYSVKDGEIFIWDVWAQNLSFPEFERAYIDYLLLNQYNISSICRFEPKATGISIVQQLKTKMVNNMRLNVVEDEPPRDSKVTRLAAVLPAIEAGHVKLLANSSWKERFLSECVMFPNGLHDDMVDCLSAITRIELNAKQYFVFKI